MSEKPKGKAADFYALSAGNFVRTRWWWVRHAPVREDGGRIYGQADPPCDTADRPTFEALARILPKRATWIASSLVRTHQTAAAIWDAGYEQPAEMRKLPELAEQDLGTWQGVDRAAFFASRVVRPDSYWFARADERAPSGESFSDVVGRVGKSVTALTTELSGKDVVSVGHGGTIRAALAIAMGLAPDKALGVAIENCSLTRFDHYQGNGEAGWRVVMVNHQPTYGGAAATGGPMV